MNPTRQQAGNQPTQPGRQGQIMALVAALLGWMFDGFEMGMFPLIGRPALAELLGPEGSRDVDGWFGVIMAAFLVGAAAGGVLFGWLGDRIGRVRAMTLSILTFALFTGGCGLATEAWHIAVLRFIASLGMGGEWSLGVALVNEVWPARSRAWIAGLIGAASNVGIGLVPLVSLSVDAGLPWLRTGLGGFLPSAVVEPLLANHAWRLLMLAGGLPALLVFGIRLWVPESQAWQESRHAGSTQHWAARDLLVTLAGTAGAAAVVWAWSPLVNASWVKLLVTPAGLWLAFRGFLHPLAMYLTRARAAGAMAADDTILIRRRLLVGAGLSGVALLGSWGSLQWAPGWALQLTSGTEVRHAKEYTQLALAVGAVVGTIAAAQIAGRYGRRITFAVLCVTSMASLCWLYLGQRSYGGSFLLAVGMAGGFSAAFYGWFPLYLPELFPTSVRATSQGFAFNFGRVLAAIGTLQTAGLIAFFDGSLPSAGATLSAIYLVGLVVIWFSPETAGLPPDGGPAESD